MNVNKRDRGIAEARLSHVSDSTPALIPCERMWYGSDDSLMVGGFPLPEFSLFSFVVYLYVSGSGSITSVGEKRANLSAVYYL